MVLIILSLLLMLVGTNSYVIGAQNNPLIESMRINPLVA